MGFRRRPVDIQPPALAVYGSQCIVKTGRVRLLRDLGETPDYTYLIMPIRLAG